VQKIRVGIRVAALGRSLNWAVHFSLFHLTNSWH
jgi:hypothetical protein